MDRMYKKYITSGWALLVLLSFQISFEYKLVEVQCSYKHNCADTWKFARREVSAVLFSSKLNIT